METNTFPLDSEAVKGATSLGLRVNRVHQVLECAADVQLRNYWVLARSGSRPRLPHGAVWDAVAVQECCPFGEAPGGLRRSRSLERSIYRLSTPWTANVLVLSRSASASFSNREPWLQRG